MSLTKVSYSMITGASINVLDYGVDSTGATDCTAQLQAAFDAAAAAQKFVYLPSGTYKYSTRISVSTLIPGIYGDGFGTQLRPQNCDGLSFAGPWPYIGSRVYRDFTIKGDNCIGSRAAIICRQSAASGNKLIGALFDNISIDGFYYAFYMQGLWQSRITNCWITYCYKGVYLIGQNINITVDNVYMFLSNGVQTAPLSGSVGVEILTDATATESSQAIYLTRVKAFQYDRGFVEALGMLVVIDSCEADDYVTAGVVIATNAGQTIVRNCWLQADATANGSSIGVYITPLAVANYDKILIDSNIFVSDRPTPLTGMTAIKIGAEQNFVVVTNNTIGGPQGSTNYFDIGIANDANDGAINTIIQNNSIYAVTTAVALGSNALNNTVGPNIIQNGTPLKLSPYTESGLKYYANGTFTMSLSDMTGATSGTVNWVAQGGIVTLTITSAITGTSNATTMTGSGLPEYLRPSASQKVSCLVEDNGTVYSAVCLVYTAAGGGGNIEFYKDVNSGVFTNSGTKGLPVSSFSYSYL